MSKKAKTAAALKRRAEKSRIKAANTAKYESWRDAGQNSKSKRSKLAGQRNRKSPNKHRHAISDCGNIGCKRCYPFGHHLIPHRGIVFVTERPNT